MKELNEMKCQLMNTRPARWDNLPDIELYKDQVLSFMKKQHKLQPEEEQLTGPMINNYIKRGMLPRTKGKRYTKEHLAYLTAICSLKQILSVEDTDFLLSKQISIKNSEEFYKEYWEALNSALCLTSENLDENLSREQLSATVLQLAISSYAQKLAAEKILGVLKMERDITDENK